MPSTNEELMLRLMDYNNHRVQLKLVIAGLLKVKQDTNGRIEKELLSRAEADLDAVLELLAANINMISMELDRRS